jgi:hypothetical protein
MALGLSRASRSARWRGGLMIGVDRNADDAQALAWILQQFSVDLNQDGLPRLGEDLRH